MSFWLSSLLDWQRKLLLISELKFNENYDCSTFHTVDIKLVERDLLFISAPTKSHCWQRTFSKIYKIKSEKNLWLSVSVTLMSTFLCPLPVHIPPRSFFGKFRRNWSPHLFTILCIIAVDNFVGFTSWWVTSSGRCYKAEFGANLDFLLTLVDKQH